jgi:hypothetical protein
VLAQYTSNQNSRTYSDYNALGLAMDGTEAVQRDVPVTDPFPPHATKRDQTGVVKMYEQKLKQLNPSVRNITYDISDLYKYIDSLGDLSCLVFDPQTSNYEPQGRDWIKRQVFQHLKQQAN